MVLGERGTAIGPALRVGGNGPPCAPCKAAVVLRRPSAYDLRAMNLCRVLERMVRPTAASSAPRGLAFVTLACVLAIAPAHAADAPAGGASTPLHMKDPAITPAFKEVDSIEARVQGCVTCHGQQGQGTSNDYFPRIAGKPAGYLLNQLKAFRDGHRRYAPMNYLVAYLSDDYLREIAEYFAAQRPPFAAPTPPVLPAALVSHGQDIGR